MLILWIATVPDLQLYPTDDGSQGQALRSPVPGLSGGEGGKLRLGGWLRLGAFAPVVGASIRALLLILPVQFPAVSGRYYFPRAWVLSLDLLFVSRM